MEVKLCFYSESSNSDDDEFVDAVSTISAEKDDDVSEENFHDVEETVNQ